VTPTTNAAINFAMVERTGTSAMHRFYEHLRLEVGEAFVFLDDKLIVRLGTFLGFFVFVSAIGRGVPCSCFRTSRLSSGADESWSCVGGARVAACYARGVWRAGAALVLFQGLLQARWDLTDTPGGLGYVASRSKVLPQGATTWEREEDDEPHPGSPSDSSPTESGTLPPHSANVWEVGFSRTRCPLARVRDGVLTPVCSRFWGRVSAPRSRTSGRWW